MSSTDALFVSSKYKYALSECKNDKWFIFSLSEMVPFSVISHPPDPHRCDRNIQLRALLLLREGLPGIRQRSVPNHFVVVYWLLQSGGHERVAGIQREHDAVGEVGEKESVEE